MYNLKMRQMLTGRAAGGESPAGPSRGPRVRLLNRDQSQRGRRAQAAARAHRPAAAPHTHAQQH